MVKFEIKEDFLLDDQPFKIMSGAIHYFRVHPDDWYHSLYNLKALGFNTVETYVPWNLHEPKKGEFHFDGILDLEKFLDLAKSLGLYAIVRPSPYICAEWEFGGFPAWLLSYKDIQIRSSEEGYLKHVADYYDVLMEKLKHHQLSEGGNVLMFQIENEYGSYGEDKDYLRAVKRLMTDRGITGPFFTSDGPWHATLRAGTLVDDDILATGNFGSKAKENFADMQKFFNEHGKKWPLMCMEFWDGWFNRYKEPVIRRDPEELANSLKEALELGSVNLYMFHGGTNFGFMNGCSARGQIDLPQVTSYDYDALLNEQGNPTLKYFAVQKMIQREFPEIVTLKPKVKSSFEMEDIQLTGKVSLFSTLDSLSEVTKSKHTKTMEDLGQNTGYILYRTHTYRDSEEEKFRVIDARDRIQMFLDENLIATQYQTEIGEDITTKLNKPESQIDILVENMGRVNYGSKLLASTQHKGIQQGVMADLHFISEWEQYNLPLEDTKGIDFSQSYKEGVPSFYQYKFTLNEIEDTNIDMSNFGKGVVFVNGHNIGRFWNVGPIHSLYIPSGFFRSGENEIIIFETEGIYKDSIKFVKEPIVEG